jgi:hypothetical protein
MTWGSAALMGYPHDFLEAINWLIPIEGGYWPGGKTDPNPTNLGITQKTLLRVRVTLNIATTDVKLLTQDEANVIYYHEYWTPAGCWKLPFPLYLIEFDTAVNCGVGNALKMEDRSNADPSAYLAIRLQYYKDVIAKHPEYAPNMNGWTNRLTKLRIRCQLS